METKNYICLFLVKYVFKIRYKCIKIALIMTDATEPTCALVNAKRKIRTLTMEATWAGSGEHSQTFLILEKS